MLILSKFKDFYDSVAQFGIDKSVVYNRATAYKSIEQFPWDIPDRENFKDCWEEYFYLGYCGILLPVVKRYNHRGPNTFFYPKSFESKNSRLKFAPAGTQHKDIFNLFKCPIFVIANGYNPNSDIWSKPAEKKSIEINPCLKNIGFSGVKQAWEVNSEIQSFLSGLVIKETPVKQTDKEKVKSHGFDKFSFRKDKK
jgi:hypothetical protein